MTAIGDDQLAGVGVGRRNSKGGEGRGHQHAGEHFAEGEHLRVLCRRGRSLLGDLLGQRRCFCKSRVELFDKMRLPQ